MKKIFFLLLFPLWGIGGLFAAVTVTPLSVDYSTQKVTFHVSWTGSAANDRVWVWVDLCPITGTSPGTFAKAEISGATATIGSITTVSGNTRGFYVTANPSTVTATLSNAAGNFNWCVYGSDAPPNMTSSNGTYTLHGTPPFTLIAADGTTTQTVDATTIATSAVTITPVTLTDETGYPGVYCIYTGSDLFFDETHLCRQRATGAQNWEAWIKDTRDDELYRIVLMPDGNWWLAQNVKYAYVGDTNPGTGCTPDKCGKLYTAAQVSSTYAGSTGLSGYGSGKQGICPNNWLLPLIADWSAFVNAIATTTWSAVTCGTGNGWISSNRTVVLRLIEPNSTTLAGDDYYGWAQAIAPIGSQTPAGKYAWASPERSDKGTVFVVGHRWCSGDNPNIIGLHQRDNIGVSHDMSVRCLRNL